MRIYLVLRAFLLVSLVIFVFNTKASENILAQSYTCKSKSLRMKENLITDSSVFIPKKHLQKMAMQFTIIEILPLNKDGYKSPLLIYGSYDLLHSNPLKTASDTTDLAKIIPKETYSGNKINLDLNMLSPVKKKTVQSFFNGESRSLFGDTGLVETITLGPAKKDLEIRNSKAVALYFGTSISGLSSNNNMVTEFLSGSKNVSFGDLLDSVKDQIKWIGALVLPDSFAVYGSKVKSFDAKLIFNNNGGDRVWNGLASNNVELICSDKKDLSENDLKELFDYSSSVSWEEVFPEKMNKPVAPDGSSLNQLISPYDLLVNTSLFGLPAISFEEMAQLLSDPHLKVYSIDFKTKAALGTVAGSLLLQAYKFLRLSGPQKVLADLTSPVIYPMIGREGYRVPYAGGFNFKDVQDLALEISKLETHNEVRQLLGSVDLELLFYFKTASDYVRQGRVLETLETECNDYRTCL